MTGVTTVLAGLAGGLREAAPDAMDQYIAVAPALEKAAE
jgi:hypothetical protein